MVVFRQTAVVNNSKMQNYKNNILLIGWGYAKKGFKNQNKKYRVSQQYKILFHTIMNPFFSYKWFNLLQLPPYKHIFSFKPRIYIKPFRPYISLSWSKKRKLKVISETYEFFKNINYLFYQDILNSNEGIIISELVFNDNYFGSLKLGYDERFRKEGELVLFIESCEKEKIMSIAFSIERNYEEKWVCLIGCIQGFNKDSFKSLQKLIYRMRPNNFIFFCLQELCKNLGCDRIHGVNNKTQVNNGKHFINIKFRHKIFFNYDNFWISVGGKKINKYWFELPLTMFRKEQTNIKSNKRLMYRKRYNFLDSISINISNNIKELKKNYLQQKI